MISFLCKIISTPIFIDIFNKFESLKLHIMLNSYQKYFKKNCLTSGINIRIYKPLSIKGLNYFSIGDNFKLGFFSSLEAWDTHNGIKFHPIIKIGNNVSFGNYSHIGIINKLIIGDNVLIGARVMIIDHNHGKSDFSDLHLPPNDRELFSSGPIIIEDNVWIGENVSILPNIKIGENSIIGANSVITKDIEPNTVVAGVPAKIIKSIN